MTGDVIVMPPSGRFDLFLEPAVADQLRERAQRIRARHTSVTLDMIEIGKEIAEAKEEVEHGAFLAWLDDEVGIAARLAQMYMRAAQWSEANTKLISHLQPTSVMKLAAPSVPADVIVTINERVDRGERVLTRDVEGLLRKARDQRAEEKRLAEEAKVKPSTKKSREARKAAIDRQLETDRLERLDRLERAKKARKDIAKILVARLEPAELEALRFTLSSKCDLHDWVWDYSFFSGIRESPMDIAIADALVGRDDQHAVTATQSVEGDLVNKGGIMDLWVREARLYRASSPTVQPEDFTPEPMFTKGALAS